MDQATVQTKRICDEIKNGLKEMNLPRYKYVVQVVIGEQRGEGVRMGSRCFWDSETDNVASETYVNVRVVRPPTCLTSSVCMGYGAVERTFCCRCTLRFRLFAPVAVSSNSHPSALLLVPKTG
ncbi:unnamed protein product [Ectocarpus sp. 4 AP-2014]